MLMSCFWCKTEYLMYLGCFLPHRHRLQHQPDQKIAFSWSATHQLRGRHRLGLPSILHWNGQKSNGKRKRDHRENRHIRSKSINHHLSQNRNTN